MVVDDRVVIKTVDEVKEIEVQVAEEAPPIPLWKLGLVLLAIIGGGTGAYYVSKGGKKR